MYLEVGWLSPGSMEATGHLALGLRSKWLSTVSSLSQPQGILVFPAFLCPVPITVAGWRNSSALWTEKLLRDYLPAPIISTSPSAVAGVGKIWGIFLGPGGMQDGGWIEPSQARSLDGVSWDGRGGE